MGTDKSEQPKKPWHKLIWSGLRNDETVRIAMSYRPKTRAAQAQFMTHVEALRRTGLGDLQWAALHDWHALQVAGRAFVETMPPKHEPPYCALLAQSHPGEGGITVLRRVSLVNHFHAEWAARDRLQGVSWRDADEVNGRPGSNEQDACVHDLVYMLAAYKRKLPPWWPSPSYTILAPAS